VNQSPPKYREPLRNESSREQEMMDILMNPHSCDVVEVVNDMYVAKTGLVGMVRHLISNPRSSARSKRRRQLNRRERKREKGSARRYTPTCYR
jgi:2,4-dienoyl-CoA reductase-like NADH-dependent reductase (Old Yellow Enzyme family)